MPEVLDWQRGDPRMIVRRAVQELAAGNLVVFPTETGYVVAASALHEQALALLSHVGPADDAVLAVRGLADALQWAPGMSTTARRLGRRVWPGPVVMVIPGMATESANARLATGEDAIRLRVPAHEAPLEVLELLGGPLVVIPLKGSSNSVRDLALGLGNHATVIIEDGPGAGRLVPTVVHVRGNDWTIAAAGAITADMLVALMPTTVLFVCTGNTCRSPLAEVFCKKLLAERVGCRPEELPERGFRVLSAGLGAMMGLEASPEAVVVAGDYGADLSGHRSQPLTAELLARADHLITMTQGHLRALLPFCLECGPEPRLLANTGEDVPDPIGAQPEVYRECAQLIYRYLQVYLPDIQPL